MKVADLLENDEWTSNPVTRQSLFKKQMSATHAFMVEVHNLLRQHPENQELRAISRWKTLNTKSMGQILSDISVDHLGFPSLKAKFDKMVSIKNQYELVGGKYDTTGPWEVPA